jgi:Uma2 family endonuclease
MNVVLRRTMTREDFLAWAEGQEERYEFDGFQPVAMTGGTNNHGAIARNLNGQLYLRLCGKTYQSMTAEGGGVATVGDKVRFPDATVTCSPIPGTERLVPDPVVVFEVLSASSAQTDQMIKRLEYQAVPSIRRYVLIDQTEVGFIVHFRHDEGAWNTEPLKARDVLRLPEIGIEIPVDDLYEGVRFQA